MKYRGLFNGSYDVEFVPAAQSLGKLCHVYSGLGSSYGGMYKKYFNHPYIRRAFEAVDAESQTYGHLPISNYILTLTEFRRSIYRCIK